MKARLAYPLLFLLPSLMAAVVAMVVAGAGTAGILWLYVHGDDAWPASADVVVLVVAVAAALATLGVLQYLAYAFGRHREGVGGMRRAHVAVAVTASVLLPALVLLHQWSIGNIG